VVGITGTPGTGKKTVAPLVASMLEFRTIGLDDLARSHNLVEGASGEVDTGALRAKLEDELRGPAVVYGHLLPYVLPRRSARRIIVLRCEPTVLKRRLLGRGYGAERVVQNVEAELIGLVSAEAYSHYGSSLTAELDATSPPPDSVAESAVEVVRGERAPPPRIDWTPSYDSAPKLGRLVSSSRR
jgi:adenylate kinase